MTETLVIMGLFTILFIIVSVRLCFIVKRLQNDDHKHSWIDGEWFDEDYLRHSKYYED